MNSTGRLGNVQLHECTFIQSHQQTLRNEVTFGDYLQRFRQPGIGTRQYQKGVSGQAFSNYRALWQQRRHSVDELGSRFDVGSSFDQFGCCVAGQGSEGSDFLDGPEIQVREFTQAKIDDCLVNSDSPIKSKHIGCCDDAAVRIEYSGSNSCSVKPGQKKVVFFTSARLGCCQINCTDEGKNSTDRPDPRCPIRFVKAISLTYQNQIPRGSSSQQDSEHITIVEPFYKRCHFAILAWSI